MPNPSDLIDELSRINNCNIALSYLMCPDDGCIDRDKTSVLMAYLGEREASLLEQLHRSLPKASLTI